MKTVNIGIIGFGTVGSGVVKALNERAGLLAERAEVALKIKYVCDIDLSRKRQAKVDRRLFVKDAKRVINDPDVDVVVELIGGVHPAKELIIAAMKNGKHIVTANKALLAESGVDIFKVARDCGVDIYFEATVAGGVPIIKALRESFAANRIESVLGIVNGTCNFILTHMARQAADFKEALKDAQAKGYAEKNPSLDISGMDSAHKLVILTLLSFGKFIQLKDIRTEGITDISSSDIVYADEFGYVIKLLAIAKILGRGLEARVAPTLLSKEHLLANVSGAYNAVLVKGDLVGSILFDGKGAGSGPTASAVVSDIVDLARNIAKGAVRRVPEYCSSRLNLRLREITDIESRYYIRFLAIDRPGVLASISGILGRHQISIASVAQKERNQARIVPIVMMTHEAKESLLRQALKLIDRLPAIKAKSVALRVER